jgi:hypothetical protein
MHLRTQSKAGLLTAALMAWGAAANAQEAAIAGAVLDAVTGGPVADVRVTVVGSELWVRTDADGRYVIDGVPPGLVKVIAQGIGFHPITTPYYTLKPSETTTVNFKLAPLQIQLDPVEVIGEAPDEKQWAFGSRIITPEDLPARGDIVEVLQGVVASIRSVGRPGRTPRLSVRGSFDDVLYVLDGTVVKPPFTFYVDSGDVECVEVRRGTRAAAEFRPSIVGQLYSGVILIWTRGSSAPRPRECRRP